MRFGGSCGAQCRLSAARLGAGDAASALVAATAATAKDKKHGKAWFQLAQAACAVGDYAAAVGAMQKAIKRSPADTSLHAEYERMFNLATGATKPPPPPPPVSKVVPAAATGAQTKDYRPAAAAAAAAAASALPAAAPGAPPMPALGFDRSALDARTGAAAERLCAAVRGSSAGQRLLPDAAVRQSDSVLEKLAKGALTPADVAWPLLSTWLKHGGGVAVRSLSRRLLALAPAASDPAGRGRGSARQERDAFLAAVEEWRADAAPGGALPVFAEEPYAVDCMLRDVGVPHAEKARALATALSDAVGEYGADDEETDVGDAGFRSPESERLAWLSEALRCGLDETALRLACRDADSDVPVQVAAGDDARTVELATALLHEVLWLRSVDTMAAEQAALLESLERVGVSRAEAAQHAARVPDALLAKLGRPTTRACLYLSLHNLYSDHLGPLLPDTGGGVTVHSATRDADRWRGAFGQCRAFFETNRGALGQHLQLYLYALVVQQFRTKGAGLFEGDVDVSVFELFVVRRVWASGARAFFDDLAAEGGVVDHFDGLRRFNRLLKEALPAVQRRHKRVEAEAQAAQRGA